MTHKKEAPVEEWLTAREATALLKKNSGRQDIPDTYIRSLARLGKIASKPLDGRTNGYLKSDVEAYRVGRRNQGKGDTVAARRAGSRRKQNEEAIA
jgi:hypothetical protein